MNSSNNPLAGRILGISIKIIKLAGQKPWPKLFQNLRASRQTEPQETYPTHVVCSWMGNSPKVAQKHSLQVTDEHSEKAQQKCAGATHRKPRKRAAKRSRPK